MPGVTVTVENEGTGSSQMTVTDARGDYQLRGLLRGRYSVTAAIQGFKPVRKVNIEVALDSDVRIDLAMEAGTVEESIVVTGEAPIIEGRRTEVAGNVSEVQIKVLPVAGRQWMDLATLLPGTGQDAIRARYYNNVNVGTGFRGAGNSGFYVDGVGNNRTQTGEPRQDFPQDAIAEFKLHGFNARSRFGFAQGGSLSTVTKGGTNQFHGSAFDFYRNKSLNSRTIFETTKPDYSRHQFGGSLGGPVIRDRAHFFGSVEYTDEKEFATVNTGGLFPQEEGTFERPNWVLMMIGRYDQVITQKHRFFTRVAGDMGEKKFLDIGGTRALDFGSTFAAPAYSVVAGETWTIGNKTLNDFRIQFAKATYQGWPSGAIKWTKEGQFPQERVDSLPDIILRPSLTKGTGRSFLGPERWVELKNDFAHVIGQHEITIGTDLNWIQWNPDNMGIGRTWRFSTDAPFDPNNPATFPFQFEQRLAPTYDELRVTQNVVYLDDTWMVGNELTLTLGVRYEWQTGVYNTNLLERTVPEIRLVDRVVRPGGELDPSLFPFYDKSTRGDWNNFAPRLGFAWNIGGDARQVLRGGYGLFYNKYHTGSARTELNPRSLLVIIRNPSYPDPYQGRDPFALAAQELNFGILANDIRNPYAHQFSLGYSRQIGSHVGVNVDGTFANGGNQTTSIDRNYFATPEDRARGRRPFPAYARVTESRTHGALRYRALELKIDRRMANRWQLLGSYTLAWARDDGEGRAAEPFDTGAEYGFSDADRRHRVVVSGIAEPFGGIQIGAVVRYQSSLAFDVTAGTDLNRDGVSNDRPPGITRNQGCRDLNLDLVNNHRTASGRTPVSSVNCDGYLNVDLRVAKSFRLRGQQGLEAIFQVFNLVNRANYLPVIGNAFSPLFGQSTEVRSPRQMELAMRFSF
jgi:hypothetical protein